MNKANGSSRADLDLARTGPGTPMGQFMRRFWLPVYRSEDLPAGRAKPIRIMSEDFALYRGASGRAQVIDYRCPHRGAQMHLGWVEDDDIRCVYHWKFDCSGQCVEQPAEEPGFARKVRIGTYPTREYLGLIFAYFGDGAPPPPATRRRLPKPGISSSPPAGQGVSRLADPSPASRALFSLRVHPSL